MIIEGIAASPGIAMGKAILKENNEIEIEGKSITGDQIENEIERFNQALARTKEDLIELKETALQKMGASRAEIFQAHIKLLEDPELIPAIETSIRKEKVNAEKAVKDNIQKYTDVFASMEDEYIKNRSTDINDIGQRILKYLHCQRKGQKGLEKEEQVGVFEKEIIIARNLTPSDTAKLDTGRVQSFITEEGSITSHTAIMARSLEIPAIVGAGDELLTHINEGDNILVDGNEGQVIINPDSALSEKYKKRLKNRNWKEERLALFKARKAVTKDGKEIAVLGNIGNLTEIESILEQGAEGIGLFRTEFLYMDRDQLPGEEEQVKAYRRVAEKMGDKPVIIRTLDIGGGKDLGYLTFPPEDNPFLGYRAIRLCLNRPDIFKPQLKAILRAASYGNIKMMYPMISSVMEVRKANQMLEEVKEELDKSNKKYNPEIEIGIMIETPAAVMVADLLAEEVDFFSIGTNDLVQYILAADRTNEKIADIYNPYHPAVLRAIKNIIDIAHQKEIGVGMCGEVAGDKLLLPFLLGAGLSEFSMSAVSILKIKELLFKWTCKEAKKKTDKLLTLETAKEVRQYLKNLLY